MAMNVETQAQVLLDKLEDFYNVPGHFEKFHGALQGHQKVSLRVLDWLVTNYAKKHNIVYVVTTADAEAVFNLFLEYKCQLKGMVMVAGLPSLTLLSRPPLVAGNSKKHFDMFCRRERIEFRGVRTTVGQLNFFMWAIRTGVLDYARQHHQAIETDMLDSIAHRDQATRDSKRTELSRAAIKGCTATTVHVKVKF